MRWHWDNYYKGTNHKNCGSKKAYSSYREAAAFQKSIRRGIKGSKRKEKLHPYRCLSCRQYHLGHPPLNKGGSGGKRIHFSNEDY